MLYPHVWETITVRESTACGCLRRGVSRYCTVSGLQSALGQKRTCCEMQGTLLSFHRSPSQASTYRYSWYTGCMQFYTISSLLFRECTVEEGRKFLLCYRYSVPLRAQGPFILGLAKYGTASETHSGHTATCGQTSLCGKPFRCFLLRG